MNIFDGIIMLGAAVGTTLLWREYLQTSRQPEQLMLALGCSSAICFVAALGLSV